MANLKKLSSDKRRDCLGRKSKDIILREREREKSDGALVPVRPGS